MVRDEFMKRYRGWLVLLVVTALCASGVWVALRVTAEYPVLGEPVSYPVNQVDGFELAIEEPSWSPFKGYTIRWKVTANSDEVYYFKDEHSFQYLERYIDGQWHRLRYSQENLPFSNPEFALGGEDSSSLESSIVQKYCYYGTRLEPGTYRVVLEMKARDGTPHYLAAEFRVDSPILMFR